MKKKNAQLTWDDTDAIMKPETPFQYALKR
jgi:hypothetical protein